LLSPLNEMPISYPKLIYQLASTNFLNVAQLRPGVPMTCIRDRPIFAVAPIWNIPKLPQFGLTVKSMNLSQNMLRAAYTN
jgi:hypothetical protein